MRWARNIISVCLLVAAAAVALVVGLSDHRADYGQVPLPQGGVVELPEGKVVVFMKQLGDTSNPIREVKTPFTFEVTPAGGGEPVPIASENGATSAIATQRSETIGELGAVARLEVPAEGAYRVSGSGDLAPGTSILELGTNAGQALLDRWKLFAGLIGGAILIVLLPMPRTKKRWDDELTEPRGWSSDSRQPYAG